MLCGILVACGRGDSHDGFNAARSDDGPGFGWNRKPSLESCLQAGMPYAQFRRELLSRGWEPLDDPNCRANVVGPVAAGLCARSPDLCRVCEDLPELSLYMPDGVALVWFRHRDDGHELQASAVGEIADRHRLDDRSRFRLVDWEFAGRH
jgi:hypothetical protein